MQGKVVKELMKNEIIKAGYTASPYDISNIPSGIYLLQLRTRERTQTEKVVITH
jgi:hypothetical protein